MPDLRIKLALESDEWPHPESWSWAVSLWTFIFRWTGRGPCWIASWQPCVECGAHAWDVDFQMDRIGVNKFRCVPGGDCEIAVNPANQNPSNERQS